MFWVQPYMYPKSALTILNTYMEGHNTWIANHEGSTFVIPVGDLAQHVLATICYFTQNGYFL